MAKIKGVWEFREAVDFSHYHTEQVFVNFVSAGTTYDGMDSGAFPISYVVGIAGDEPSNTLAHNGERWVDEAYRLVDFGTTEQEVPEDFYVWFTANATRQWGTYTIQKNTLDDIGNAIREKLNTANKYTPAEMAQAICAIDGGDSHYDTFWDNYQDNGNRTDYYYGFSYNGWNDECFNPKHPITCTSGSAGGENVFYYNSVVTRIPVDIVVRGTSARQIFYRCTSLKSVKKLVLDGVTDFRNMFVNCSALEHIILDGGENGINTSFGLAQSPNLDAESRQSIVDSLADLTGKDQQTLTLHATAGGNLTAEQKATITAKNWNLVY